MLHLYHHGTSVCAAKVRLVLCEKALEWEGTYVDILRGEQFTPEYLALNPKGVVPTLVHDGRVIRESTVICEYLDDAFPDPSLRPADPYDRARMRLWGKLVDEESLHTDDSLHTHCAVLTFVASHRYSVLEMPPEKVEDFLGHSVGEAYRRRKREWVELGFDAPDAIRAVRGYLATLEKMEETLCTRDWLAGDAFSLADLYLIPYVNRLKMLGFSHMWQTMPRVADWFGRVRVRASFAPAVLEWIPDTLVAALRENGRRSLPALERCLARSTSQIAADEAAAAD